MAKKVSQQVIADSLGISQAIVSGVLNNKSIRASEETRRQIHEKAKTLNYKKPTSSKKSPDLIALIIHSEQWENLLPVTRGMRRFLEGTNTLIVQHEWKIGEDPSHLFDNVKGCISVSLEMARDQKALEKIKETVPLVFIHVPDENNDFDAVLQDATSAYKHALKELWNLGHRRFGYFGIQKMSSTQAYHVGAFTAAMLDLDYPQPEPDWLYFPHRNEPTDIDTRQRLREYLDLLNKSNSKPTAVFFENDGYARLFKELTSEYNLRIPEDISIVGHSDKETNSDMAVITLPWEEMGYIAIKALLERISNPAQPIQEYRLAEKWILGSSIAKAKN